MTTDNAKPIYGIHHTVYHRSEAVSCGCQYPFSTHYWNGQQATVAVAGTIVRGGR